MSSHVLPIWLEKQHNVSFFSLKIPPKLTEKLFSFLYSLAGLISRREIQNDLRKKRNVYSTANDIHELLFSLIIFAAFP